MSKAKMAAKEMAKRLTNAKIVESSKKGSKPAKSKVKIVAKEKAKKLNKDAGKDELGSRKGSKCSTINEYFSEKTPTTAREIHEDSGISLVLCRNHIQTLLTKGILERTDEGVVLVKQKPTKKAKAK